MARTRNDRLAAVISETGWTQAQVAARFVKVAAESGAHELTHIARSHISLWVLGAIPSGRAPRILCETLSRGLARPVTLADIGLAAASPATTQPLGWDADTLTALHELGGDDMDMHRRHILSAAAYSVAGLALPDTAWWDTTAAHARQRPAGAGRLVGRSDVDAVRELLAFFSLRDQRRGGGHGRLAVVAYLHTDVAQCLSGRYPNETVQREMLSVVGELTYLSGWMGFDACEHTIAQQYFTLATKLAAEADDPTLAAHILRAMAHQAVYLGHHQQALDLAEASVERHRYTLASPRERALLGVVHGRALAAAGRKKEALAALQQADRDLDAARPGDTEPGRVWFFQEASLSHETACALRDLGDLKGAEAEFVRSVRTRKATAFTRTHAVTLGYLGAVQAQQGSVEAACATWSRALDAMDGIQSGRARDTVTTMRRVLSPFRNRGIPAVAEVDARAAKILRPVA
ncbi:Tat pathway signal protein [Streptomyces luteireticuli]|uniref:Tat pathway signal protein n=1 Tax=Streptomyces luteireticuli TaxID=173858 RepID=UPI00355824C0